MKLFNNARKILLAALIAFISASLTVVIIFAVREYRIIRETGRTAICDHHLAVLGVLFRSYYDRHGHFPPAYVADEQGRPIHSWRILLMETAGDPIFNDYNFNEPWNGPNNSKLLKHMPDFYSCPNDENKNESSIFTNYVVITGPGTLFPGTETTSAEEVPNDISQTIMVAEIAGEQIPWLAPWDLEVSSMSFHLNDTSKPSISSNDIRGPGVVFGNGLRGRFTKSPPPWYIKSSVTVTD